MQIWNSDVYSLSMHSYYSQDQGQINLYGPRVPTVFFPAYQANLIFTF